MKVQILKSMNGWASGIMAFVVMLVLTACPQNDSSLTDAEIASVAVTANQIDVEYGEYALEKSENPTVRKFAETMIKDHKDIIEQAGALAQELGVTPKDNVVTQSLLDGQKDMLAKFDKLEGLEFDKAYMQNEEDYHDAVITAVKETLIPQTENAQLKDMLVKVSPLLEHHLQMAKDGNKAVAGIPELTDPQIASIAVAANAIDVRYGKIALEKSQSKEVRHFAETMIKDHENIINQAVALAEKLGVTPDDDNPITQALLEGEKDTNAKFDKLSGKEFNQAYIDNEVAFHDAVIDAVQSVLIPYTENEELKNTLIKVSPLLKEHLKMAQEAQKRMK